MIATTFFFPSTTTRPTLTPSSNPSNGRWVNKMYSAVILPDVVVFIFFLIRSGWDCWFPWLASSPSWMFYNTACCLISILLEKPKITKSFRLNKRIVAYRGKMESNTCTFLEICFHKVGLWITECLERKLMGVEFMNNRRLLHIETFTISFRRWRLVSGRVHFRPGLHFVIIHLRRGPS